MPPPGSSPRPDPGHGGRFRPARPGLRRSRGWEEPRRGCAGGGSQAPRAADGSVRISRVGGGAGPLGAEAGPQGRRPGDGGDARRRPAARGGLDRAGGRAGGQVMWTPVLLREKGTPAAAASPGRPRRSF